MKENPKRFCLVVLIVVLTSLLGPAPRVSAGTVGDVFRQVNVSVVVIRAKGRTWREAVARSASPRSAPAC